MILMWDEKTLKHFSNSYRSDFVKEKQLLNSNSKHILRPPPFFMPTLPGSSAHSVALLVFDRKRLNIFATLPKNSYSFFHLW